MKRLDAVATFRRDHRMRIDTHQSVAGTLKNCRLIVADGVVVVIVVGRVDIQRIIDCTVSTVGAMIHYTLRSAALKGKDAPMIRQQIVANGLLQMGLGVIINAEIKMDGAITSPMVGEVNDRIDDIVIKSHPIKIVILLVLVNGDADCRIGLVVDHEQQRHGAVASTCLVGLGVMFLNGMGLCEQSHL